jgi:ubiquinone/menaquinone biosynthesis C-methylase UbiE
MTHHSHSHSMERPARTEGSMIRWAAYYDFTVNIMTMGRAKMLRTMTIDRALIQPGNSVLDIGCGTGEVTWRAKSRAGSGQVYGIDPAPEMIAVARKKAVRLNLDIDFRVGVIESLPFPDSSLDVVTSSLMMHHLPDELKRRGLAEIYRVLQPGGRLLIADFMRPTSSFVNHLFLAVTHHRGLKYGIEDLRMLLNEAGFADVTEPDGNILFIRFVRATK